MIDAPVDAFTCEDLLITDDDGTMLYRGPKYLRCKLPECRTLVTQGMIQTAGGCWCGNRKLGPAIRVTAAERAQLHTGYYPLVAWEAELIQPRLEADQRCGWGKTSWEDTHA